MCGIYIQKTFSSSTTSCIWYPSIHSYAQTTPLILHRFSIIGKPSQWMHPIFTSIQVQTACFFTPISFLCCWRFALRSDLPAAAAQMVTSSTLELISQCNHPMSIMHSATTMYGILHMEIWFIRQIMIVPSASWTCPVWARIPSLQIFNPTFNLVVFVEIGPKPSAPFPQFTYPRFIPFNENMWHLAIL